MLEGRLWLCFRLFSMIFGEWAHMKLISEWTHRAYCSYTIIYRELFWPGLLTYRSWNFPYTQFKNITVISCQKEYLEEILKKSTIIGWNESIRVLELSLCNWRSMTSSHVADDWYKLRKSFIKDINIKCQASQSANQFLRKSGRFLWLQRLIQISSHMLRFFAMKYRALTYL